MHKRNRIYLRSRQWPPCQAMPQRKFHESSLVRLRALSVIDDASPETAARWLPSIRRLLTDRDPELRASAVGALANIQAVDVVELVRPSLSDSNPRIAMTAAMVLAEGGTTEDIAAAECVLEKLRKAPRDTTVEVRKELAALLRHIPDIFRRLLIPLLTDSSLEVAQEALRSVRQLGNSVAGKPLIRQGRCLEDTRFLRVDREDLLDLLMQRPDLQRQLLGSLFRGSQFPSRESPEAEVRQRPDRTCL